MLIASLNELDLEKLKSPVITLLALLTEMGDQKHANGIVSEMAVYKKENQNLLGWLKSRKKETDEISDAVKTEIFRRFTEMEKRAKISEEAYRASQKLLEEARKTINQSKIVAPLI